MRNIIYLFLLLVPSFALAADPVPVSKPDAAAVEEKKEIVKTGVIASTGTTGEYGAVNVETGGASPGDEMSVISASISRTRRNECVARITNNGEKTYSISFSVVGTNQRGGTPLNKYFSATAAPAKTIEKLVTGCAEDLNLSIVLKSAKATGK